MRWSRWNLSLGPLKIEIKEGLFPQQIFGKNFYVEKGLKMEKEPIQIDTLAFFESEQYPES